ncbi:MAG: MmgE/PrpD family protein [Clostridia bacterium]|nr:MmgE/PrpD family protein [Clostridia bacterium]
MTKQLSDFLHALSYEQLSPAASDTAKMCVEDLLGVALAGSVRPQGEIWRRYFSKKPAGAEATVWTDRFGRSEYENAAALNAACAHVIDMDDVHNSSITHLGAVTIPAALAAGQKYHRSGREVIAAIAAGYEIGARVGEAINPGAYDYWHTTGVVGGFTSAVAVGKLMRLNRDQLLSAIGSAGTQASGLWQFLHDGAMSKTLHTANATLCGIRSAELAALGFTAAQDILCGERGFLGAMTGDNHPEAITRDLGKRNYKILSNSLKPYACCRHTHSADYCAENLRKRYPIDPNRIAHITDYTYQVARDNVDAPSPATPYGYKFSVQYCIAAMFLYGELPDSVFTWEQTSSPEAQKLMGKVTVVVDAGLERLYQSDPNKWPHRLEVTMDDGAVYTEEVEYPFGDFNNPFDWDAEHRKFFSLTDGILPGPTARALTRRIAELDEYDDVNELFAGLPMAAVGA